ncbi:putative integral membrane protein [Bordetella holmesii 35009]|nr:putative integral membrane protein [Bordetella holmesii 35009]
MGYQYALGPGRPAHMVMLTQAQVDAQDASLRQRETEARFLRAQLDTADGEIAVERAARQELETQLRTAQTEVGRVRDQLAFYEQ